MSSMNPNKRLPKTEEEEKEEGSVFFKRLEQDTQYLEIGISKRLPKVEFKIEDIRSIKDTSESDVYNEYVTSKEEEINHNEDQAIAMMFIQDEHLIEKCCN